MKSVSKRKVKTAAKTAAKAKVKLAAKSKSKTKAKARAKPALKPFMTNLHDVPKVGGLAAKDGWVNMQVQFLIDQKTANSDKMLVGWTVLPPGAQHDRHRHFHCDEFWIVVKGRGVMYTNEGEKPSSEGDVVFTPRGHWHGFKNNSSEDVVLVWGWSGAGSLAAAGYESVEGGRTH